MWLPDNNALTGPIPSEIGLMTSLTLMRLCKLVDHFIRVDSGFCLFHKKLKPNLEAFQFSLFTVLSVHDMGIPAGNGLSGPIPTDIGGLTNLVILNFGKLLYRLAAFPISFKRLISGTD
jgi:hypothetical protein